MAEQARREPRRDVRGIQLDTPNDVATRLVSPTYNYERFDVYVESGQDEREFGAFPNMLHAGERAPDGELTVLDGERASLSELWRERGIVLEFGSFT